MVGAGPPFRKMKIENVKTTLSQKAREAWGTPGVDCVYPAGYPRLIVGVPRPCLSVLWRDRAGVLIWTNKSQRHTEKLPLPGCPLRLDLNHTLNSRNIVKKTTPDPILRIQNQSSLHGIAMHVAQFFNSLLFAPYVEVVIGGLAHLCATTNEAAPSLRLGSGQALALFARVGYPKRAHLAVA